jgi:hypothetical protein
MGLKACFRDLPRKPGALTTEAEQPENLYPAPVTPISLPGVMWFLSESETLPILAGSVFIFLPPS